MLTGEQPASALTPPSTRVEVDVRLDEVVLRALAETPERRWQSATDLRTQLETIVSTKVADSSAEPPPLEVDEAPAPATPSSPAEQKEVASSGHRRNGPLWLAIALGIPGVPLAMFGVFMLVGVLNDPDWNPSPQEAFLAFASWSGAVLLLGTGFLSLCFWLRRQSASGRPRRHVGAVAGLSVAALLLLAAGIGLVSFGAFKTTAQRNADISRLQARWVDAMQQSARAGDALTEHRRQALQITDPAQQERYDQIGHKLEKDYSEARRASELHRKRLRAAARPREGISIFPLAIVGIAVLAFCVGGFIILAKLSKGGAIGCLVVVLGILALLLMGRLYFMEGRAVHSPASTQAGKGGASDTEAVFTVRRWL